MKTTKLVSVLLSLAAACSTFVGCSRDSYPVLSQENDLKNSQQPLTLLGKRFIDSDHFGREARLYFDMDGDTNTTEIIAAKSTDSASAEARVFDAKIGDKKTRDEWDAQLHHKVYWGRVKE